MKQLLPIVCALLAGSSAILLDRVDVPWKLFAILAACGAAIGLLARTTQARSYFLRAIKAVVLCSLLFGLFTAMDPELTWPSSFFLFSSIGLLGTGLGLIVSLVCASVLTRLLDKRK